jgi:hypothetical protein
VTRRAHSLRQVLATALLLIACAGLAEAAEHEVWVNTSTGVYHCPGTRWYANTKSGRLLPEEEARTRGYRPAYGSICFAAAADTSRANIQSYFAEPSRAAAATQVWVNTSSHVYHCPGSQYYGATKSGRYMTEPEALGSGNRPAYGARCN